MQAILLLALHKCLMYRNPLSANLPDGEVSTRLVLLLPTRLAHLVELQHRLAGASKGCDNLPHATGFHDWFYESVVLIRNGGGKLHAAHQVVAADKVGGGAESGVVGEYDLWEEAVANLGQVLGFSICGLLACKRWAGHEGREAYHLWR